MYSFLPATTRTWNDLPLSVRSLPSLTSFKQSLYSNMSKPKLIFRIGSRRAKILHTWLGCSSLNFDLHRRSTVDSPLCSCGSVETVDHFLLHCPLLADIRLRFLSDMSCPPILQNLLFGNQNLSTDQNKVILTCTRLHNRFKTVWIITSHNKCQTSLNGFSGLTCRPPLNLCATNMFIFYFFFIKLSTCIYRN